MRYLFIISFFIVSLSKSLLAQNGDSVKTIVVQILHGSKPNRHMHAYKTLGGYYGGHVVIQIDSFVYGFNFFGQKVHPVPYRKHRKGIYEKQNIHQWNKQVADDEVTSFYIPVTKEKYERLKDTYESYYLNCPHDYAFFGMRCAASAYWMLGKAGVIKESSRRKSIIHSFHPKMLRKKLVRLAKRNKFRITEQKGNNNRKWEGV